MPKSRLCALACLFLLAALDGRAQLTPDNAAKSFDVSDGLAFDLWASEPLFVNPTCMDVDHLGRVWVCESVNYRNKLRRQPKFNRAEGDRIVILEDSKGKGKADKQTTFYQHPDVLAPLGIAVAKDPEGKGWKVYLCQSPDILILEDADGDGKADGPPKKLLSGFRGYDHDHGVHGILIGPDLKLYFSVGDAGVDGLQSSDGKGRKWKSNDTDCRAGTIWRCDLDGKNLELLAHNFRNNYEPCVDSFGNVFISDNDDDGNQQTRICHVLFGGDYGYHPRGPKQSHWHEEQPGVVHKILRTYFGSPTGMCVYEGKLLPKKYHGQPLHTDAGPRHVRAYHLTAQGASYDVKQENVVSSKDNWFRPADVCVAPDGSVFVADWYDPGVGGHGMGDTKMGRIYRLAPKGDNSKTPKVDLTTDKGILEALNSPALSVRFMAMAKLDGMKRENAIKLLEPAAKQTDDPCLQARAVWQLVRVQSKRGFLSPAIFRASGNPDPRFQQLALRALKDFHPKVAEKPEAVAQLCRVLLEQKAETSVLRECLIALRDVDPEIAKPLLYALMKRYDGKDRFYLAAVGIAVGHHDQKRRDAILDDFGKHFTDWDDKVAGLVWELRPPKVLPLLEKKLGDDKLSAEQRVKIVDILAASSDKNAGEALVKLLATDLPAEVRDRVLENLRLYLPTRWKGLGKSSELTKAIDGLLEKPQTRVTGISLVAAANRTDRAKDVAKYAASKDEPPAVRKAAIAALGQMPAKETSEALGGLLADGPSDLRADVVKALGELAKIPNADPAVRAALKALQDVVTSDKAEPALRESALLALTAGRAGTLWLLELKSKDKLPETLAPTTSRLLRNSQFPDLRAKALIAFPPIKLDLKKLPAPAVLAKRTGDAARGKKVLADSLKTGMQCLKCHTVRGVGGYPSIGPDLSMIGKKASKENLYESILDPSKAIADQYVTWIIETNKGLLYSGLIVEETKEVVVLRDNEGRDTRVPAKSIDKRTKGTKSIMPEDLAAQVTEEELVDLVEYLFTLKTPALAVDSWHVVGPFDNGSGMEGLDKVFPPEKSIDLTAKYDGKGGKTSWKTVRAGPGGYVDLQAFFTPDSNGIVSYLTCEIESPADQDATVLLGSDDGAKLWVNDKLLHTTKLTRAALPEQDTVKLKLKKGNNRVLLKINNGDGGHGFYFTILAEQELKMAAKK